MSQLFNPKRRTKKNLKTPKELIWEFQEKNYKTKLQYLLLYRLLWFLLFFIRILLSPLMDFKIGILYSNKIGRFLGNTEFYLRAKSIKQEKKTFHILLSGEAINNQVLKMISRKTILIKNDLIFNIFSRCKKLTTDSDIWVDLNITGWLRDEWIDGKPQLNFSNEEEEKGEKILNELGINKDEKFVCMFAKDSLYSDDPARPPKKDSFWAKKDFRNCDIKNYLLAAKYLTDKNIYVIRMGLHNPLEKLETNNNKIIDYTGVFRSKISDPDFADVYLPAKCKFYIGCTSGIYQFASIFNTPVAYTNMIPYGECGRNFHDIVILKKCFDKKNNKILPISNCINLGIKGDWLTENQILDLENKGIYFLENTAQEILDLTIEMNERIDDKWMEKDDQTTMQSKFMEITQIRSSGGKKFPGRIGYKFLKNNPILLN